MFFLGVPSFLGSFAIQGLGVKLTSWNTPQKMRCSVRKGPRLTSSPASSARRLQSFPGDFLVPPQPQSTTPPPLAGPQPPHQQPNTSDFCAWLFHANFYPWKDGQSCSFLARRWCRNRNRWHNYFEPLNERTLNACEKSGHEIVIFLAGFFFLNDGNRLIHVFCSSLSLAWTPGKYWGGGWLGCSDQHKKTEQKAARWSQYRLSGTPNMSNRPFKQNFLEAIHCSVIYL